MKRLNAAVLVLMCLVGCGGAEWEERLPAPGDGGDLASPLEPSDPPVTRDVDTLDAQEQEQFPSYILWWPTSWRIVNISQVDVPIEVHCRSRRLYHSATLVPGEVAENTWQCRGDPLKVKNLGTKTYAQIIQVSVW